MDCPKCFGKTGVYHTVTEDGEVQRLRRCRVCGYRFRTIESFVSPVQGCGKHGGKRIPCQK